MTQTSPLTLLTIIALDALEERLVALIKSCGVHGYTLSDVEGEGLHTRHFSPWEGRNIKLETIGSAAAVNDILNHLEAEYFERYSIIAYTTEVQVIRRKRFE
jgi:nitrogen regulatory protein P-II 2